MVQIVSFDVRDNSVQVRPFVSTDQVKEIAFECYGLKLNNDVEIKELNSYDDRNFLIEGQFVAPELNKPDSRKFVLKIYNTSFAARYKWYEDINLKCEQSFGKCKQYFSISLAIRSINAERSIAVLYDLPLQKDAKANGCRFNDLPQQTNLLQNKDGAFFSRHMVRLTPFISGKILDTKLMSNELAYEFGKCAAILDSTLKVYKAPDFDEDAQKKFVWNMMHTNENLYTPYVETTPDPKRKQTYEEILNELNNQTLPKLKDHPLQWIHGDLNDQNILIDAKKDELVGIIDFDDMRYSYRVIELAIMLMYLTGTSTRERSMDLAKYAYQGYSSVVPLTKVEMDCLYNLMLVRYTQSCCFAQYQYNYIDPGNKYILITYKTAIDNLDYILSIGKENFLKKIQGKS